MRQGHYEDALALSRHNLPSQFANSDSAVWQNLTQGSAFTYLERYPEAERALHSAQALASSAQPQLSGEVFLRLGTLASLRWELDSAKKLYLQCLQSAQDHADPFLEASALGSLGLVAARMGRYGESTDWNNKALDLDRAQGLLSLATKAEGNIGWNFYLVGDFESALEKYKQAIQDAVRAGQEQDHALWLISSGQVFYDKRDYAAATDVSLEALRIAEHLNDPANTIYAKQNLALIAASTGQLPLAQQYVDESLQMEGAQPDQQRQLYTRLIDAQVALLRTDLTKAEKTYGEIARDPAATVSIQWEALAGIAQVHAAQGKLGLAEKEYAESIDTISKAQEAVEREDFRLSFLSSAIRFYDEYVNFLISQNRPLDALRVADRSRAQTLEHGLSLTDTGRRQPSHEALRPQDIARRQNASLLFYWLGPTHSFVWVITPASVNLLPLPARAEIDATAAVYRKSFLDPRDPLESGNANGKKLYDVLVRPTEKFIPKNSRVVILPDGSLTGLNFETLITSDPDPHYWIEDVTVSVADSLSLLEHARRDPPPASPSLLFFGDAISPGKDFPPLADAGKEAAALQKHLPADRMTLFTRERATPSNFLSSNPGRYSYLHFATHGTASMTRPLESAIILSKEENGSFKLYARDIVGRPLNAYLVSISACNGAGERVLAGEGLVGLSWAFLRAGAHNVVAGLWEVSTVSAPPIIDDLYRGVTQGQDPATALRNAKLALVHSNGPYRRPFYWAPFQLYSGS
ncbi:MAG TPA: CHAT domain-containing protein [Candidatus Acidoferrum sp.]|nr:CHAT domain-containing protein [Candidatus Acidoferrum sp.]